MLREPNQIARVCIHGSRSTSSRLVWSLALLHKIHKVGEGSAFAHAVVAGWIGIPSCVGAIGEITVAHAAISQSRYNTAIAKD